MARIVALLIGLGDVVNDASQPSRGTGFDHLVRFPLSNEWADFKMGTEKCVKIQIKLYQIYKMS